MILLLHFFLYSRRLFPNDAAKGSPSVSEQQDLGWLREYWLNCSDLWPSFLYSRKYLSHKMKTTRFDCALTQGFVAQFAHSRRVSAASSMPSTLHRLICADVCSLCDSLWHLNSAITAYLFQQSLPLSLFSLSADPLSALLISCWPWCLI